MTAVSSLDAARQIANAVLYEGYVLFPYRASATKNRYRWQWGVVVPEAQADLGAGEPSVARCEVPLRADATTEMTVTVRFLQLVRRQVVDADGRAVDELEVDSELHISWDEGLEREVTVGPLSVEELGSEAQVQAFAFDGMSEDEPLGDAGGTRRMREPIAGELEVSATPVGEGGMVRISAAVTNTTAWRRPRTHRDEVLRRSFVGTHLILSVRDGRFASVIDPPTWAQPAAADCRSRTVFPVLVGGETSDDVVLAAPIILEDHPEVAVESPGPSFDALEIDELLALCVRGLSGEEKREARATDPRAAELIDRSEGLPPAVLQRLHGRLSRADAPGAVPEPEVAVDPELAELLGVGDDPVEQIELDGCVVHVGDTVRLRPRRRADVHDLFADGRLATVERIVATVEGPTMLAVTLVDDPAAELHRWYGRFQYFHLDEVDPSPRAEDET